MAAGSIVDAEVLFRLEEPIDACVLPGRLFRYGEGWLGTVVVCGVYQASAAVRSRHTNRARRWAIHVRARDNARNEGRNHCPGKSAGASAKVLRLVSR